MKKRNLSTIGLFFATLAWGLSFFLVKEATAVTGIWPFLFWRFGLAILFLILLFPQKLYNVSSKIIKNGTILGGLLFLAISTQTVGLQLTSIARSGFITSLYVPLVPVLALFFLNRKITLRHSAVVSVAMFGLYTLTLQKNAWGDMFSWWKDLNSGDGWTMATALFSALHIVMTEKFSREDSDSLKLGLWQFIGCFACVLLMTLINAPQSILSWHGAVWQIWYWPPFTIGAILVTSIIVTDFGFVMQIVAQKSAGALKAALIFGLEAPLASLFAFLF